MKKKLEETIKAVCINPLSMFCGQPLLPYFIQGKAIVGPRHSPVQATLQQISKRGMMKHFTILDDLGYWSVEPKPIGTAE